MSQPQLPLAKEFVPVAVDSDLRELGEVFTRDWVVEFILDAVGYDPEQDLAERLAVEPSCGSGAFLVPMVRRLLRSVDLHQRQLHEAVGAIRAFDINGANVEAARRGVRAELLAHGVGEDKAESLAEAWVVQADYLLEGSGLDREVDYVVGNPPYIRLEAIPRDLQSVYRDACPTMRGRADIYIGFFDVGLRSLSEGGALGFICSDRWMRNAYGSALRELITSGFSVDLVTQMHDVDAFEEGVTAYPAVIVLRRGAQGTATVAHADSGFDDSGAASLFEEHSNGLVHSSRPGYSASQLDGWFDGDQPWPDSPPEAVRLIRHLEEMFPGLEDETTGTKIGIGVATGADAVFITRDADLVEESRLLPLAMAGDLNGPVAEWGGAYLVNPWNGISLVELDEYPRLKRYLAKHSAAIKGRYVAKKRPDQWYRTIDRVTPGLQERPKLLLPDIKAAAHPVLDEGGLYPHHNLYVITSDKWDLRVLGGLLISDIAQSFVKAYSVKMRGGYFRYQAQNLRRIHVPHPDSIPASVATDLAEAFEATDRTGATAAALWAYGIEGI